MEEQIRKNSSSVEVNYLLDFSISQSDESQQAEPNSILHDRAINVKRDEGGFVIMSKEELMIRAELEIEIERNLEEEIKDEMYNLGLRLHRLYRHRRERIAISNNGCRYSSSGSRSGISKSKTNATYSISEMNITIKMGGGGGGGGGSKIEIKEIEKRNGGHEKVTRPKTSIFDDNYKQAKMYRCIKEFDWVRTLRSSSSSGATNGFVISSPKKYERC